MSSHSDEDPSFIDSIEENIIAFLLGAMTIVTFANVIARYVFNSNILWALELTVFMFAWLVLLGASYAVKKSAHLGVDAVINLTSPETRRVLGLLSAAACVFFAFLLLKGSWDYWANFVGLPKTEGRWFPTGFEDKFRSQGWYEVNDIPMPEVLRFVEDLINDGDEYEKLPRAIPYLVMPLSMALLLFRSLQAAFRLWKGDISTMIASHEVEDQIDEAAEKLKEA